MLPDWHSAMPTSARKFRANTELPTLQQAGCSKHDITPSLTKLATGANQHQPTMFLSVWQEDVDCLSSGKAKNACLRASAAVGLLAGFQCRRDSSNLTAA